MKKAIALVAALASLPGAAEAAGGAIGLVAENDVVSGADRDYTSGLRLVYLSAPGEGAKLAKRLLGAREGDIVRYAFGAGQSIYTPQSYALPAPPPGQHPYAGWLYADGALLVERGNGAIADIATVTLGVVGPAALGEQAQKTTHRVTGDEEPLGWDNQLRNEPGLAVSFDRMWRMRRRASPSTGFEFAPFAGVTAGNILTEARAGAVVRFGDDPVEGWGPVRVRSAIPSLGSNGAREFSWSVFGGAAARAVARDIFLDGNSFVDSASVEKRNLVGEFQAGVSLRFNRFDLSYTHVWSTRRYETEPEGHAFGALSLTRRF